jgi:hypothetical protein
MSCRYTIIKSVGKTDHPICQLEVHFSELEMPSSFQSSSSTSSTDGGDCSTEYLNFDAFGKVCGSIPSGTVKFFPFETNVFTLNFRSDSGRSASAKGRNNDKANVFHGFHLKIRQRECMDDSLSHLLPVKPVTSPLHRQGQTPAVTSSTHCGEVISTSEFEVRSPYYPSSYSENVECVYTIKKSNARICSMELRFVEFDVEESPNCEKDYLLMDGKKLCGRYKANTRMNFDFSTSPERFSISELITRTPGEDS